MRLLTPEEKAEIERLYEKGLSHQAIADRFGFTRDKIKDYIQWLRRNGRLAIGERRVIKKDAPETPENQGMFDF